MAELDDQILASCSSRWQKVAMIIARVNDKAGFNENSDELDAIATRIEALVEAGELETAGNLLDWRRSEVRLTQPQMGLR